jgi:hypothetical protein
MSKVVATTVAIFILLAVVFGFVDDFRLVMALIVHDQWTVGSYLHPVWTPLEVTSGVVCALLVLGFFVGATRARLRRESVGLFEAQMGWFLVLVAAGAVSGLWLPFIHYDEADVGPGGFVQDHYVVSIHSDLMLYNPGPAPVTVCLGAHGVCSTAPMGPGALRAPGLTVQPGQTVDVRFADGNYGLTVVADVPGRDATVEAFTPTCEADPDDSTCIDDDVVSR